MRTFSVALLAALVGTPGLRASAPLPPTRFPVAGNDQAWKRLPLKNPPLPTWARTLSRSLPRTTALMLNLDHLHRAKNPLGSVLAGKLRWIAADEIKCDYARRYAAADLKRAGVKPAELKKLAGRLSALKPAERALVTFARKMTKAAHTVTDDEVAGLLKTHRAEKVVAMVHTLAWANFHNRLLLALRCAVERGGPLPPLSVVVDPKAKIKAPARPAWKEFEKAGTPADNLRLDWKPQSFDDLGKAMEVQKARKGRIPLPDKAKLARVPAPSLRIVWSTVSVGYQPEMTLGWFSCFGAFREEADLPRQFTSSMFWVITRSNDCFY